MKHVIVLFLMFAVISLQGQDSGLGKVKWIHDLGFKKSKVVFIGNTNNKFFWMKKQKAPAWVEYHKKAEEQKLYVYDVEKKKTETFQVQVEQGHWFIQFKVHGGRLHAFMSSYDKKAKQVSYWHKAYQISNMSEVGDWKLLGKVDKGKIKDWKKSNLNVIASEINPKTGSVYVKLFNRKCREGFGIIVNSKGDITKQFDYPLKNTSIKPSTKEKLKRKGAIQELLVGENDEKLIRLIQEQELEGKRNSELQRDLKEAKLAVEFVDLVKETHKKISFGEKDKLYLSGFLIDMSTDDEVLITTISIPKESNDRFRSSIGKDNNGLYSLFSVSEQEGAKFLDKLETKEIHRNFYERSLGVSKKNISRKLGEDKLLVSFLNRRAWREKEFGYSEYERIMISVAVNTKTRKLEWETPIMSFDLDDAHVEGIFKLEHISYMKNRDMNVVMGLQRFQVDEGGNLEELTPFPKKKDKNFRKKLIPFFSHGFVERANDFIIVGSDGGTDLYIGTLKK